MKRSEFVRRMHGAEMPILDGWRNAAELIASAIGLTDDDVKPTPGTEAWRITGLEEEIANLRDTNKRLNADRIEAERRGNLAMAGEKRLAGWLADAQDAADEAEQIADLAMSIGLAECERLRAELTSIRVGGQEWVTLAVGLRKRVAELESQLAEERDKKLSGADGDSVFLALSVLDSRNEESLVMAAARVAEERDAEQDKARQLYGLAEERDRALRALLTAVLQAERDGSKVPEVQVTAAQMALSWPLNVVPGVKAHCEQWREMKECIASLRKQLDEPKLMPISRLSSAIEERDAARQALVDLREQLTAAQKETIGLREQLAKSERYGADRKRELDSVAAVILNCEGQVGFGYWTDELRETVKTLRAGLEAERARAGENARRMVEAQKERDEAKAVAASLTSRLAEAERQRDQLQLGMNAIKEDIRKLARVIGGDAETYTRDVIIKAYQELAVRPSIERANDMHTLIAALESERDEAKATAAQLTVRVGHLREALLSTLRAVGVDAVGSVTDAFLSHVPDEVTGKLVSVQRRIEELERYAASATAKSDRERAARFYMRTIWDHVQDWIDGGSGEDVDQDVKDCAAQFAQVRASAMADVDQRIAEAIKPIRDRVTLESKYTGNDDFSRGVRAGVSYIGKTLTEVEESIRARGTAPGKPTDE